jgi:hypothetical protein
LVDEIQELVESKNGIETETLDDTTLTIWYMDSKIDSADDVVRFIQSELMDKKYNGESVNSQFTPILAVPGVKLLLKG